MFLTYLYVELWAGDIELLWGQDPLLTTHVLQDHRQVDQVVSHHILILSREDLLLNHLDWRDGGRKIQTWKPQQSFRSEKSESADEWDVNLPSLGASWMTPWVSQKVSEGLWLYSLAWALRCTFIILATLCLLTTLTVKRIGCPATGALSRVRKTNTPFDELSE